MKSCRLYLNNIFFVIEKYFSDFFCRMMASHSADYSFVPKSWVFPDDVGTFQQHWKEMKRKGISRVYIVKPLADSSARWVFNLALNVNCTRCNLRDPYRLH